MKNWSTTKKIVVAIIVIAIIAAIYMNWDKITGSSSKKMEVKDANGKGTGRFVNVPSSGSRGLGCCAIGSGFFIGKGCKFPITKSDNIPSCGGSL